MKKIRFYNIVSIKGSITFKVESKEEFGKSIDIYFKFDRRVKLYNDQIAYLLSTLCGEQYEAIEMDLDITKEIKKNVEEYTKAKVKANIVDEVEIPDRSKYKNITICFSGGFDSLACMYALPKAKLAAVDFGEWFEREAKFFMRFKPKTVSTNIRRSNIRLDKNTWTFMGCSIIIYCDFFKTKYNVFGTALEDPIIQLEKNSYTFNVQETAPFKYLGFKDIKLVNGLTAVGTAMMVLKYGRPYLNDALIALASTHDEKRYRKQTILDILCKKQGLDLEYEHVGALKDKIPFGKRSIFVDFVFLDGFDPIVFIQTVIHFLPVFPNVYL